MSLLIILTKWYYCLLRTKRKESTNWCEAGPILLVSFHQRVNTVPKATESIDWRKYIRHFWKLNRHTQEEGEPQILKADKQSPVKFRFTDLLLVSKHHTNQYVTKCTESWKTGINKRKSGWRQGKARGLQPPVGTRYSPVGWWRTLLLEAVLIPC